MDPATMALIANLVNAVPSIFQGIVGGKQLMDAKQIESQNKRPTAEVAPSIQDLVGYSKGLTLSQDIPGGTIARDEIKAATAAGMRAASELGSGAEAYGMLGNLVGREQNQFSELAKLTAQQVAGYQGDYMNALGQKANEENRVWEWNKAQPYLMAAATARELRDSGLKNINSGLKNVFGTTAETIAPDFNSQILMGNSKGTNDNISWDEVKKYLDEKYSN